MKSLIKKNVIKKGLADELGVVDSRIGGLIRNKFDSLKIVSDDRILELHRGMREHLIELLAEMADLDAARSDAMNLGLSHVLSRHKIKFSAEKVDTMIIQVTPRTLPCTLCHAPPPRCFSVFLWFKMLFLSKQELP